MALDDPTWTAYEKGGFRPRIVDDSAREHEPKPPLILHPATLPYPASIPPRQWLYGIQLLRGYVSVLVAPGGTGKTAYATAIVLALVAGRPLLVRAETETIFLPILALIPQLIWKVPHVSRTGFAEAAGDPAWNYDSVLGVPPSRHLSPDRRLAGLAGCDAARVGRRGLRATGAEPNPIVFEARGRCSLLFRPAWQPRRRSGLSNQSSI